MSRLDRLDLLARVLRDRPGITVAELARDLGVSERSVFRDISHLRERGLPIEGDRGRGGGVRLHHSWGLGRVLLANEEALCALLALAIAEKLGFPMFAADLPKARRKLVDAFPTAERKRIGPLRERIFVSRPASARVRESWREPDRVAMRAIQVAFVREQVLRADYVREDGARSSRRIEPHALVISWPAWYLLAWDHTREATRHFRCDRFVAASAEDGTRFRARPREMAAELLSDERIGIAAV